MNERLTEWGVRLALVASAGLPFLAGAQVSPPPPPIQNFNDVQRIIITAVNWLFTILMIVAVVFILIAAFRYLTAAGDPEKVKKANHSLIYAAIAIAVGLLSRAIGPLIASFLGTSTGLTP